MVVMVVVVVVVVENALLMDNMMELMDKSWLALLQAD